MAPSSSPFESKSNASTPNREKRETERLAALDHLDAVRPEVDSVLQQLVDDVREAFRTDLCLVNLVLSDVQYFRAWSGELPIDLAEARQGPRERSMCQYVVETQKPLVVEDFLATEKFKDQHFRVRYGIRFYAGTPLVTSEGHTIGTLCLLGTQPKEISEEQMKLLGAFAKVVVGRLELLGALRREQTISEDEARRVSRMILQRAVQKFGYEVPVAEDGRKAWELYRETPEVDVVISDWIDGLELCHRLREEERDEYTFFIFLTTLSGKEHLLEGMQAGADDYLSKPLDRDQLEVRLIAAARITALHRQLTKQKQELEKLNFELFKQARRDPLTRLGNCLRLHEDLEALRDRVERYGHSYCAVLCDVDSFKLYNDHYGHLKGDEVLQKVAEAILQSFRTGDASYRYGGEEFLIILPEQTLESAALAAERLRRAVEELAIPHEASKPGGIVTVSCGLAALSPGEKKSVEEFLNEADEALYQAKEGGKNKVAVSKRERAAGTESETEA